MFETQPYFVTLQEGGSLPATSSAAAPPQAGGEGGAQTAVPPDGPAGGSGGSASSFQPLLLFGLLFVFMWFFMIRPERKRQRERNAMLAAIEKGDQVVTSGGMYGTIVSLDEKTVTLKVADNVRIKFDRNAVARIASGKGGSGAEKEADNPQALATAGSGK